MPWVAMVPLAAAGLVAAWLAWWAWRFERQYTENHAAVWQALAGHRMRADAIESATAATFQDVGREMRRLYAVQCQPMWPAPRCNCKSCRDRRAGGPN